jgi:hypothetical protein
MQQYDPERAPNSDEWLEFIRRSVKTQPEHASQKAVQERPTRIFRNASFFQYGMSQSFATMIDGWDATARSEALAHIENMIARKQTLFPHDKRVIVSWDVWFEGDNFRVSAAALTPPL